MSLTAVSKKRHSKDGQRPELFVPQGLLASLSCFLPCAIDCHVSSPVLPSALSLTLKTKQLTDCYWHHSLCGKTGQEAMQKNKTPEKKTPFQVENRLSMVRMTRWRVGSRSIRQVLHLLLICSRWAAAFDADVPGALRALSVLALLLMMSILSCSA